MLTQPFARPNLAWKAECTWAAGSPLKEQWSDDTPMVPIWSGHLCLFRVAKIASHEYVKSVR